MGKAALLASINTGDTPVLPAVDIDARLQRVCGIDKRTCFAQQLAAN